MEGRGEGCPGFDFEIYGHLIIRSFTVYGIMTCHIYLLSISVTSLVLDILRTL